MTRPLLIYTLNEELRKKFLCIEENDDVATVTQIVWIIADPSSFNQWDTGKQSLFSSEFSLITLTQPSFSFWSCHCCSQSLSCAHCLRVKFWLHSSAHITSVNWLSSATSAPSSLLCPLDSTNQLDWKWYCLYSHIHTHWFFSFSWFCLDCSVSLESFLSCAFLFILHESAQEFLLLFL